MENAETVHDASANMKTRGKYLAMLSFFFYPTAVKFASGGVCDIAPADE
jgi:hypothetical protein